MKRFGGLTITVLLLCLFVSSAFAAGSSVPSEVQAAATAGLQQFKDKVVGEPKKWGFNSSEEVNRSELGQGFQLHYIDADKLRSDASNNLLAVVAPANAWEFLVTVDGQAKTFLTIGMEEGQYRVVHMGGKSTDLGVALTNFSKLTAAKGAGTNVQLTLVQEASVYYLVTKIGANEFVLPAMATEKAGSFTAGMDYTQLRPSADVVKIMKEMQKNSVPGERGVGGLTPAPKSSTPSLSTPSLPWMTIGLAAMGALAAFGIWRRRHLSSTR